ncbi:MAG: metal-dependent transcriptional regulator [Lachnospiraceae bacterium]|nr:metal-dependent transcriptional regulator [Lachnospiraceae bacterium]
MKIHESAENYLESILMLSKSGNPVRSVDIANELEYSKPSVSVAMKNLREGGYINVDADGYITLTESGNKIAQDIYERHTLISDWLMFLGVSRANAVQDACKMEHAMSDESYTALRKHFDVLKLEMYKPKKAKNI